MAIVEILEAQVQQLGSAEFKQFNVWFAQYKAEREANAWDEQIERDATTGKLDALANRAREHRKAGRMTDI